MELAFSNNAAEFRAETAFNLHIEGADASLFRRTSGTQWDFVKTLNGNVIDEDVAVNIPKEWKVVVSEGITMCVVTMADGTTLEGLFPTIPEGYALFLSAEGLPIATDGDFLCRTN